jgi:hypothetical protein
VYSIGFHEYNAHRVDETSDRRLPARRKSIKQRQYVQLRVRESAFIPKPATTWREKELAQHFVTSGGCGGRRHGRCGSNRTGANSPIRGRALASMLESVAAGAIPTLRKPKLSSMFRQVCRQPSRRRTSGFHSNVIHGFYELTGFIVFKLLFDRLYHVAILSERGLRDRFTSGSSSFATWLELEFRSVWIHPWEMADGFW